MATHFSILAWEIPWTRGAWWATVHGIAKESDTAEHTCTSQSILFHSCQRNLSRWQILLSSPIEGQAQVHEVFKYNVFHSLAPGDYQTQLFLFSSRFPIFAQLLSTFLSKLSHSMFYVSLCTCVTVAAFALKRAILFFCLRPPLLSASNPKESSPPLFFSLLLSTNSLSIPVFL